MAKEKQQRKLKFFKWGPPELAPEPLRQAKKPGKGFLASHLKAIAEKKSNKEPPTE